MSKLSLKSGTVLLDRAFMVRTPTDDLSPVASFLSGTWLYNPLTGTGNLEKDPASHLHRRIRRWLGHGHTYRGGQAGVVLSDLIGGRV